jgi:titin
MLSLKDVSIQWFKNIDPIKQSKYFDMKTVDNTHTLTILEAFPEDEGEYKCVVTNPAGSTSSTAYLKIERKFS